MSVRTFPYIDIGKYLGRMFDSWDKCNPHQYMKNGRYRTCFKCGKSDYDD